MNKLIDLSKIFTGYNLRETSGDNPQTVYLVSVKDLSTNFTDIEKIDIPSSYSNFLQEGDILVKSRGSSYEAKIFKSPNFNYPYIASNTLIVVRLKDERYKPSYIVQIINSSNAQQFLKSLSLGQTVPSLSPASLGALNCPACPIEEQNQLEVIIRTIDEYQVTLTRYVKAGENLTKILKNNLMKGGNQSCHYHKNN